MLVNPLKLVKMKETFLFAASFTPCRLPKSSGVTISFNLSKRIKNIVDKTFSWVILARLFLTLSIVKKVSLDCMQSKNNLSMYFFVCSFKSDFSALSKILFRVNIQKGKTSRSTRSLRSTGIKR